MRDLCNKIKALSALFVFGLGLTVLAATPTVTSVTAQQRYPWNGLVDIVVTISGEQSEVAKATCTFAATNSATKAALAIAHVTQVGTDTGSGNVWTRRFLWDTNADLGEVKIADVELVAEVKSSGLGGVQLWDGGPYWAECNVGASKPEECGYYFMWGDTVGHKPTGNQFNGSLFTKENCSTWEKTESELLSLGYIDSTGNLMAEHDAATAHLGAPWRTPTFAELYALSCKCDTSWTMRSGVYGRLVTGRGTYASKSVFLPAAGYCHDNSLMDAGSKGFYWSSTPNQDFSDSAKSFYFYWGSFYPIEHQARLYGFSVRPIRGSFQAISIAASTHFVLDNRAGVRIAEATERIHYSPAWATDAAGAIATVSVNGVAVESATASGAYGWTPTQAGTYQFTHVVFNNGEEVGETLSATFVVSGMRPISADWSVGSITLKATGVTVEDGESVWLSYCDANAENGNWDYVDSFTKTVDDAEKSI